MLKQFLLKYTPIILIKAVQHTNKRFRRFKLAYQLKYDKGIDEEQLITALKNIGLKSGDSVLVHSSFSKIGYVKGGAQTFINALIEVVGDSGTLLFPAFPATGSNQLYLQTNPVFDIVNTPSKAGMLTEYFRTLPNVYRSFHPTDSVAALGYLAEYYTQAHYGQLTPYNESSPFYKLRIKGGKILMIGTNACSTLHTLEDTIVNFKYKAYNDNVFNARMIDSSRMLSYMKTKTHNARYTSTRNFDMLIPLLTKQNSLKALKIGSAKSMLVDAQEMCLLAEQLYYQSDFIPFGDKKTLEKVQ